MTERRRRTGGQLVADALRAHEVRHVFCVPGESYLDVLNALFDARNDTAVVSARHEHGAANMAEAYAKLTGRVGVCMVTRGPGACNASIGVHTASQDSTPLVLLVGQVPREYRGREAFQEVDYGKMFAPLAKWAVEIERTADIPYVMERAFHVARTGRPGPVVVALPEDILADTAEAPLAKPRPVTPLAPSAEAMARFAALLKGAERPILHVGGGGWTAESRRALLGFAHAHALPMVCSFRRHDIADNADSHFAGEIALSPDPKLVARIRAADLVVALGTRLGEITTQDYGLYGTAGQRLVHVYPAADDIGKVFAADLGIVADPGAFLEAATQIPASATPERRQWVAAARGDYEANNRPPAYTGDLDLGQVIKVLEAKLADDAVVSVDAGNYSGWVQRFLRVRNGQRFLGPTSGAMGYAVPAAVAAKVEAPGRMAVACVGDGGFGMTGQEFATAALCGVAPVVLVFNNRMYGTIRMHQERRYPERVMATALANPDFAALARAYGGHGETVRRTAEFGPAFDRAVATGKPAIIELVTDQQQITSRATVADLRAAAKR